MSSSSAAPLAPGTICFRVLPGGVAGRWSCTSAPNYAARAAAADDEEARVPCRWEAPPKGIVTPLALTIWALERDAAALIFCSSMAGI